MWKPTFPVHFPEGVSSGSGVVSPDDPLARMMQRSAGWSRQAKFAFDVFVLGCKYRGISVVDQMAYDQGWHEVARLVTDRREPVTLGTLAIEMELAYKRALTRSTGQEVFPCLSAECGPVWQAVALGLYNFQAADTQQEVIECMQIAQSHLENLVEEGGTGV